MITIMVVDLKVRESMRKNWKKLDLLGDYNHSDGGESWEGMK